MILAEVGLLGSELVEVVCEVVRRPRISIPVGINWIGRRGTTTASTSTSTSTSMCVRHGEGRELAVHVPPVIPGAEVVALEPLEAA
jgi:hypothetical protein